MCGTCDYECEIEAVVLDAFVFGVFDIGRSKKINSCNSEWELRESVRKPAHWYWSHKRLDILGIKTAGQKTLKSESKLREMNVEEVIRCVIYLIQLKYVGWCDVHCSRSVCTRYLKSLSHQFIWSVNDWRSYL